MKLLHYDEWQGANNWYCNDTSSLATNASKWWMPARMLGISPAQYVELLITKYKPDSILFNGETLIYSWKKQTDMRKFKNWINAEARKRGFMI